MKTAATASTEFKPPSRSGAEPSRGCVASPSGTTAVARSLGSRLAKVARPKKKSVTINPSVSPPFAVMCARDLAHSPSTRMQLYALKGLYSFAELLFQCLYVVHFLSCFCCLLYTIVSMTLSARGLAHSGT